MDYLKTLWTKLWLRKSSLSTFGRTSYRLASLFTAPYVARCQLAALSANGFISHSAQIYYSNLKLGKHVYIGERVKIYQDEFGGQIRIGDNVQLNSECMLLVGKDAKLIIGDGTSIQNGCQIEAYIENIEIGKNVLIAPKCALFSSDINFDSGNSIREKTRKSNGQIIIGNGAWLSYGVIVMSGVRIGRGAIVGAGAVVETDIPDGAIAIGIPAKIKKMR